MHLFLSGYHPFAGKNETMTIENINQHQLDFNQDA